ncbi:MAG: glycosyltransferase family 39 protein [Flavobacteriales bacterium]
MLDSYFTAAQQQQLVLAIVLGLGAVVLHFRGKHRAALVVLTMAALVLRLWACFLDPFLNHWDEVFHGMVGKNMVTDPFKPMLFTEPDMPVTGNWSMMHIWLHKPPFFLWQIALSISLFGPEPWAVRIPSALWMTAYVPLVYRIATLLLANAGSHSRQYTAFGAALLTTFSFYIQELVSGATATEHNDAVFFGCIAGSTWVYLEYLRSGAYRWVVLVGLFSACAMLTKWYFGAIVFLPWTLRLLYTRPFLAEFKKWALAASCMALPVLAWVAYITLRFPAEAAHEWTFKAQHFAVPMDGHDGPWHYHLNAINELLHPLTWWIVSLCLVLLVLRIADRDKRIFIVSIALSTHVFFAFAATKMLGYTMFLLPLYLIAVAHGITMPFELIKANRPKQWGLGLSFSVLAGFLLNIELTQYRHTVHEPADEHQLHRRQHLAVRDAEVLIMDQLGDPERTILFNVPKVYDIQFMFRTGVLCMRGIPSEMHVEKLRAKGYTIKALQDGLEAEAFPSGIELIPDSVATFPRIARP